MFFWHLICVIFLVFGGVTSPLFSQDRGSSAPLVSGDTFRALADHLFDETTTDFDPSKVKEGDLIFVKTDWEMLEVFFSRYHPQIAYPYILLTHNSDHSTPGPFSRYLHDPKLLAWFAQNVEGASHPKLHSIPIGIANRYCTHGNPQTFLSHLHLAKNQSRPWLCYMNFQPNCPLERNYVKYLFANKAWCVQSLSKPLSDYLHDLSRSKFVLSPRGNGPDCHRTWEALLMGAIPIVRTSILDPLYADLPVLIVKEWNEITESWLNEQYEIFHSKTYDMDKLFIKYWIQSIQKVSLK